MATHQSGSPGPTADCQDGRRRLPPTETLQLVAHDDRRAILDALWAAEDAPLEFSTLRDRVGIAESTRFNYHLQQLVDDCVRAGEDGYALSDRGERFVRALTGVPSMDRGSGSGPAAAD